MNIERQTNEQSIIIVKIHENILLKQFTNSIQLSGSRWIRKWEEASSASMQILIENYLSGCLAVVTETVSY